eukprot:gene299-1633_t
MLQSIRLTQDENAGGVFQSAFDKENAGSVLRKPGLSGTKPGLSSSNNGRRALGNITNLKQAADLKSSSGDKDGKGGGKEGSMPARRAFGDITNRAPQQGARGGGGLGGPSSKPKPALTQRANPMTNANPMSSIRSTTVTAQPEASHRGLDGIERLAGKGWKELEADRVEQEEWLICQRVKAAAMVVPSAPQGLQPEERGISQQGKAAAWAVPSAPQALQMYSNAWSDSEDDALVLEKEPLMPLDITRSHELLHSE